MTKITLGISPCPNDTFIFGALILGKVNTEPLDFEVVFEDVQSLNNWALDGKLACTKLSYHAYLHVTETYAISTVGSALGHGCGPLLLANNDAVSVKDATLRVAIPGNLTTANMLLAIAYPHLSNTVEYIFSNIEDAIVKGEVDAGVIIHENRFTYQSKGLVLLQDLGEYWEKKTGMPIPLGCIAIHRDLHPEKAYKITELIKESLTYAYRNPDEIMPLVRKYAQEMDEKVIRQHIDLYVNDYSFNLGSSGKAAILRLFEEYPLAQKIKIDSADYFVGHE